jgi:transposase
MGKKPRLAGCALGDQRRDVWPLRPDPAAPHPEGDVIILNNLSSHKSHKVVETLRDSGVWFAFLPLYSPP